MQLAFYLVREIVTQAGQDLSGASARWSLQAAALPAHVFTTRARLLDGGDVVPKLHDGARDT